MLTPIVLLAAGLPMLWPRSAWLVAMLAAWILPFSIVYAFYYHTHETWEYLRFLLPAFPPLVVSALLVGRRWLDLWPLTLVRAETRIRTAVAALAIAAAILVHNLAWASRLHAADIGQTERVYVEVAEWTRARLPEGSAVAAMQTTGALFFYSEFPLLRWDAVKGDPFLRIAVALEDRRQPLYAVLFPFELEERRALTDFLPGTWTLVGAVRDVTIWRFDGPRAGQSQRQDRGAGQAY
jgi:hypothetical protein